VIIDERDSAKYRCCSERISCCAGAKCMAWKWAKLPLRRPGDEGNGEEGVNGRSR
jgi:hypothetical protein